MSIRIENLNAGNLQGFQASAPAGAFIGLVGHGDSGISPLLDHLEPEAVTAKNLSALTLPERYHWLAQAQRSMREGRTVFAAASDPEILRHLADEVWWLEGGKLVQQGDPREVLAAYSRQVIAEVRSQIPASELHPTLRRGDGRATLLRVECRNAQGEATALLSSGEAASIVVQVEYQESVENPVVGIMIRTRIGMEVYGTNTELEGLRLGPASAGQQQTLTFRFACLLCPQSYTVTAASHDPDGVWHDWLEDAISFQVAATRYTAGVANLAAHVELS